MCAICIIDHMLIVLPSLLCTWPTPTVLLEYIKLQLVALLLWMHSNCIQSSMVMPAITTEASAC